MKKAYLVLSQISHDGKTFLPPGSNPDDDEDGIIYLTDEEAQRLKACDAIEEIDDGPLTPSAENTPSGTPNGESNAAVELTTLAAIGNQLGEITSGNIEIGQLILDPSLTRGTPSGDSTAAADALAEQTDKETNQDPLNNKDGGDATLAAQTTAAASTNIEEANGPAAAEGNASATPEAPEASAPGAEGNLTPASADAVQDPVDPAPAVDSTAGGEGQTILDPAATPLDGAATGVVAAPVAAEAPAPANPAPAAPVSKKTRKATAAK